MSAHTNEGGLSHPLVWLFVIAGTMLSLWFLNLIWWLALPVLLAIVFVFISTPILKYLQRFGMSYDGAVWGYLSVLTIAALVVLPLMIIWGINEISALQKDLEKLTQEGHHQLDASIHILSEYYVGLTGSSNPLEKAWQIEATKEEALHKMSLAGDWIAKELAPKILSFVVTWVPSMLLVPYLAFFMLQDGRKLKRLMMRGVPNAFFERALMLFYRIEIQMRQFFSGLMAMTVLDTITLAPGLYLLGRPYGIFDPIQAILLGFLAAVLSWIPYIGTGIGCLVIMFVCMLGATGEWWLLLWVVLLFATVRGIDDFIYTPLTIGRSLSAHPLLTVLMIFCGGVISGIPGLLLAMPLLGLWMVLGEVLGGAWLDSRLKARHAHAVKLRHAMAKADL